MRKQLILLFLISCTSYTVLSQKSVLSTNVTVGISTPILDNGTGLHVGINPYYAFNRVIGIEGQLSYVHTNITGSFINGKSGYENSFNLLIGGRVYLFPKVRKTKPYLNLLIGGLHNRSFLDPNGLPRTEVSLGASAGLFLEMKRFLIGISADSPSNLILKTGLRF